MNEFPRTLDSEKTTRFSIFLFKFDTCPNAGDLVSNLQFKYVRGRRNPSQKEEEAMSTYRQCPRCGERSYEVLNSYSHCINCLYTEDRWQNPETPYFKAMQEIAALEKEELKQQENETERELEYENKDCA